jgi:nucleoside-diphosphate-sugar epimerase
MRIFLTGATGFIGSRITPLLLEAGHQVLGLTRSDAGAQQLAAAGAEAHRGDLEDPASLQRGAEKVDAVIHCAFDHDFSRFVEAVERGERGARYHAVAEEAVTTRAIAEALGRRLKLPVVSLTGDEAAAHFGWMAMFAGLDMAASSAITREKLGWNPVGPGLIADLEKLEI